MTSQPRRFILATLIFLVRGDSVCLGLKKRGFKKDDFNGYGGKLSPHENPIKTAMRELKEESGIVVQPHQLIHCSDIEFVTPNHHDSYLVSTFVVHDFKGNPVETAEMSPHWFKKSEVPYDRMTPDVKSWLPFVLQGKKIAVKVYFSDDHATVSRVTCREVKEIPKLRLGRQKKVILDREGNIAKRVRWKKPAWLVKKRKEEEARRTKANAFRRRK